MSVHHSSDDARQAGVTYHLVPAAVWERQKHKPEYTPEAYVADGFIHCTDGLDQLLKVANAFYRSDDRPYVTLVLAVSEISSPIRYEDPDRLFPHIYGPLNTSAVRDELAVDRGSDGSFLRIGPPTR